MGDQREKTQVFDIPVKIEPFTSVRVDNPSGEYVKKPQPRPRRDDQRRDPFAVVIEPYPGKGR
jgi:hypothetical protein